MSNRAHETLRRRVGELTRRNDAIAEAELEIRQIEAILEGGAS